MGSMPDRRIQGRPLKELLDTASELEQQRREIDAKLLEIRKTSAGALRSARLEAGISAGALASSLGTSQSYVSQVEHGVRVASVDTLHQFYGSITSASAGSNTWDVSYDNTQQEVGNGDEVNNPAEANKKKGRKA